MNRRKFLKNTASLLLLGSSGCYNNKSSTTEYDYKIGYKQSNYLRPPGSVNETDFVKKCINCFACAEACPIKTIKFYSESLEGKIVPDTPYVIAADKGCILCLKCTTVCPTGAILPVKKETDVKMGKAYIIEKLCLPYINQGGCGACYTICPVNAVKLKMQRYPIVIDKKCVGCGLCEEICLQKVKAIRIKDDIKRKNRNEKIKKQNR